MTMFKDRPDLLLVVALPGVLLSSCTSPDPGEEACAKLRRLSEELTGAH